MSLTIVTAQTTSKPEAKSFFGWCRFGDTFSTDSGVEIEATVGSVVTVAAGVQRVNDQRGVPKRSKVNVVVTGDETDTVTVTVGAGKKQFSALLTGVEAVPTRRWSPAELSVAADVVIAGAYEHRQLIKDAGGRYDPDSRVWVITVESSAARSAVAALATKLEAAGASVTLESGAEQR